MFIIEEEPFGPFTLYKMLNQDTQEYVSILPGYGAIIQQLVLATESEQLIQVIDGYDTSEQLLAEVPATVKGNLLFPFPNRINEGKYVFGGEKHQLPINEVTRGHALHGLLYKADFEVVAQGASATGAFLILEYEADGKAEGYPFKYLIDLDFRLKDDGFSCKVVVQNLEEKEIPVGMGYHPTFKLGGRIDEMLLKLPIHSQLELDSRMIPTGNELAFDKYLEFTRIESDSLNHAFHVDEENALAVTQLYDPKQNASLVVWQYTGSNQFNYLQIYTPASREGLAIEPMTCAPNAFNNGKGLILLQPDETVEATFGVRVE
jgi:aldose 1-epimerase